MKKPKIKALSDSEDIRIYVNDILHIRLPRDKNTKVQSWIEGNTKTYIIEIWCSLHSDLYVYDNKFMWVEILKEIDKHL